jgi:hypothetical protein
MLTYDSGRLTLMLYRRRALGELSGAEQRIGARVRKSRQKEAAGAARVGLVEHPAEQDSKLTDDGGLLRPLGIPEK